VFRGRRVESLTVGKQPGRQVAIYNKRREAIERKKFFWFETWGRDQKDKNLEVWRVEVRAGKKELKDKYRIVTMDDFEASIGDVITRSLGDIRYLADGQQDSNVSRHPNSPLWRAAQTTAAEKLCDLRSGLTPDQLKNVERTQAQETYLALCAGNAIGFGIAHGMTDEEIVDKLPELIGGAIAQHFQAKGAELYAAIRRSRERLVFLE
jgi:hypothetical protein